jgi:hypothetical protein
VNGAGGGVLGGGERECKEKAKKNERGARHRSPTCGRDEARRVESRAGSGGERVGNQILL